MLSPGNTIARSPSLARQSGLSIVELLVGIAVGLFVLAGAATVASNQLSDNKKLLLETQVQQDMRAAMDIIVRDIRRSGYTPYARTLVRPVEASAIAPSGYKPAGAGDTSLTQVLYTYRQPSNPDPEPAIPSASDHSGFRLQSNRIEVQLGQGNFQALTDTNVVRITNFSVNVTENSVPLPTCSAPPCATATCPLPQGQSITTRDIDLQMDGEAVHDPKVKRTVQATVRVRNDEVCR